MEREFAFTVEDFSSIASLVYRKLGIRLSEEKQEMVYARLARRLRKLGLTSFVDYRKLLESATSGEMENLANAMTTNVTSFFREIHHFQHLSNIALPEIYKRNAKSKQVRMWSAGSSVGMEAYSMAMVLHATDQEKNGWNQKILATDVDTNVLNRGMAGEYDEEQLEKIPPEFADKYIERHPESGSISIQPSLKKMVHFKHLNLLEAWPMQGAFDVIFCRNVVIYFDKPTQAKLFARFAEILNPNGWIYIGHSENLHTISDQFEMVGKTTYRKL